MFQLEESVRKWCATNLPEDCRQGERFDELEDHLRCEVERLQRAGLDQERAFVAATGRMGEAKMLMSEFAKDRSFVSRLCALDRRLSDCGNTQDPALRKMVNRLTIGHAILWAAAMIATALLLRGTENAGMMPILVMVPLWFASFMLLTGATRSLGRRSDS